MPKKYFAKDGPTPKEREWAKIVAEWRASGQTGRAFCRQHGRAGRRQRLRVPHRASAARCRGRPPPRGVDALELPSGAGSEGVGRHRRSVGSSLYDSS